MGQTAGYVGIVLSDGHLSLPDEVIRELGLESGQRVEVTVRASDELDQLPDDAYAPLRKLIGLAQTGRTDAAERHDEYLYQEDPA